MASHLLITILLALSFVPEGQAQEAATESSFDVPIAFATLGDSPPIPEVATTLIIKPADADQQVSDLLLNALQSLGFAIESPQLTLESYLEENQQWQSSQVELTPSELQAYNLVAPQPLPSGSVYAVRYSGRYAFVKSALRMVLSITLMQRSQLGEFKEVNFGFSRQFFVTRLEAAVKAQVANNVTAGAPPT
ncbi:hypothetical protein LOY46_13555 [Pseudomonas sichuanensis]|uniref:hypothetical protein n=1 Tax=Pseudomonas sichuanensis TaxID=2213015 RepID=UPI00215F8194|nr:hypothetical protein [Pseudomonas sichuanensis]UVK80622.1 hypothetical protein LOY46_13555 [Pseudomonas sichuanensis]